MATPLLEEQALANLSPILHGEFTRFCQEYLQPNEEVFSVVECSCRGFESGLTSSHFGFFVITGERALLAYYEANLKREQIRFYQEGEGFFYHVLTDETVLALPPSPPLHPSEIESRQVQEALLSMIETVERRAYSVTVEDHLFQCIELNCKGSGRGPDGWLGSVGLWRMLFDARDGQAIYNLLHISIQAGGHVHATVSRDEMLQRLERLASLYQAGMLTEEEFQAGKRKLLGLG
jgi:hypothetical protein